MKNLFRDKPVFHKPPGVTTGKIVEDLEQSINHNAHETAPIVIPPPGEQRIPRMNWYGNSEFLFVCLGYSLGMGHVWRFPSLVYKHRGGAFFLPYTICLLLCALPVVYLELVVGQFSCLGPIQIWRILPLFKGVGYTMTFTCCLVLFYHCLLMPLSLYYFFGSMKSVLDFQHCNHTWNSYKCKEISEIAEYCSSNETDIMRICSNSSRPWNMPAEEYFKYVLGMSNGIEEMTPPTWELTLCLLFSYLLILMGILRGLHHRGKLMYVTVISPWIFLIILLIRNSLTEGSWQGIVYYLKADWSQLEKSRIWMDAAGQALLSMGPSLGVYMTLASYNKFHYNVLRDALYLMVANFLTSFIAGFVIFSSVGELSRRINIHFAELFKPGLMFVFVVYTESIANIGAATLWSLLTFLILFLLTYNSHVAMIHSLHLALFDQFPETWRTRRLYLSSSVALCLLLFLVGLLFICGSGLYWFELLDYFVTKNSIVHIALITTLVMVWGYSWKNISKNIFTMTGGRPSRIWRVLWSGVSPGILLIIIIYDWSSPQPIHFNHYIYPGWALIVGLIIGIIALLPIPCYMIYSICTTWRNRQSFRDLFRPQQTWDSTFENEQRQWLDDTTPDYINIGPSPADTRHRQQRNNRISRTSRTVPSIFVENASDPGATGDILDDETEENDELNESDLEPWRDDWHYLLSCLAYTLGICNFARFPFLCYKYGGFLFCIPYFITMAILGAPLCLLESTVGQYSGLGPLAVWQIAPMLRGVGFAIVLLLIYLCCYNHMIVTWSLFYFFTALTAAPSWDSCNNLWNTPNCRSVGGKTNFTGIDEDALIDYLPRGNFTVAAEEFFLYRVLGLSFDDSPGNGLKWFLMLGGTLLSLLISISVIKHVHTTGKIVAGMALTTLILLLVLIIFCSRNEGASIGLKAFFTLSWDDLLSPRLWYDASYEVLLSLGVGFGVIIGLASHNKYHVQLKSVVITICVLDVIFSFLSALAVFAILGIIALPLEVSLKTVIREGTGIVFSTLSSTVSTDSFPHLLLTVLLFCITFLGITNSMQILYTIIQGASDFCWSVWRTDRLHVTLICFSVYFCFNFILLFEGGFQWFRLLDTYVIGLPLLILCLIQVLIVAYGFGYGEFDRRMKWALGEPLGIYWRVMWCYVTPGFLILLIPACLYTMVTEDYIQEFSVWTHCLGAILLSSPIMYMVAIPLLTKYSSDNEEHWAWKDLAKFHQDWDENCEQILRVDTREDFLNDSDFPSENESFRRGRLSTSDLEPTSVQGNHSTEDVPTTFYLPTDHLNPYTSHRQQNYSTFTNDRVSTNNSTNNKPSLNKHHRP